MIVSTTSEIAGEEIAEVLGMVRGSSVRAKHLGKDLIANLRNAVGGEIHEYTTMLAQAREQAIDRMVEEAQLLDADAVVAVRFQTSMVARGAAEMLCYGTAVKFVPHGPVAG